MTSSDLTWGPKEDDNYSAIVESTVGLVHLLFKTGGWIGAFLRLGKASGFFGLLSMEDRMHCPETRLWMSDIQKAYRVTGDVNACP